MEFNLKKWVQVINFFAKKEQETTWSAIDKLKILKLVWIADRLHLRKYWKLIVWDTYFAMKMWPVASAIKNICEVNEQYLPTKSKPYINEYLHKFMYKIRSKKDIDFNYFSDSNIEILELVYNNFWNNNSFNLVNFTHHYPEWTKFKNKLDSWEIIQAQMNYLDFFENTPAQDQIFDINDEHLEISKDIFKENFNFHRLFS